MKYCGHCGTKLEDNENCTCAEAVAEREKAPSSNEDYTPEKNADYMAMFKKHKIPIIIAISAFVLMIILAAIIPALTMEKASDYISIKFDGINGYGTASVVFSERKLIEKVLGEEPDNFEEMLAYSEKFDQYRNGIGFTFSPEENLSNGDEVTIKITVSGIAASKISGGTLIYEVAGLPEGIPLDVFADFTYSIKGINGSGQLDFQDNSDNGFIKKGYFSADKSSDLSNGDVITVTFKFDIEDSLNYGYVPVSATKTITVSGLGAYLKNVDDLPKETLKTIADSTLAEEIEDTEDSWAFTYATPKYYKSWFLYALEDAYTRNIKNKLVVCITCDRYRNGGYYDTIYSFYEYKNIILSVDGTINLEYMPDQSSTFTTNIDASLEDWQEKFTVTEINIP